MLGTSGARLNLRDRRALVWMSAPLAALLVAVALGLTAPYRGRRNQRREAFDALRIGSSRAAVRAALGAPNCRGEGLPAGGSNFRDTAAERASVNKTHEYWVYSWSRSNDRRLACQPDYEDGVVAFDRQGNLLWYDAMVGETYVVH
jgi:hypothetical protein